MSIASDQVDQAIEKTEYAYFDDLFITHCKMHTKFGKIFVGKSSCLTNRSKAQEVAYADAYKKVEKYLESLLED